MLSGFGVILLFAFISIGLSAAVVCLPFFISRFVTKTYKPYAEKSSAYECGFNPEGIRPSKFNIKYYLVGILFIVFDLEISFLFPWAVAFKQLGWLGFGSMMLFLALLTITFVYVWKKGALNW